MKKSELKQLIKEEISKILKEENKQLETWGNFEDDFHKAITYAGLGIKDNIITIWLENEPNKEKNIINKLVREKYSNSLKKINSELDVMKFKIIN